MTSRGRIFHPLNVCGDLPIELRNSGTGRLRHPLAIVFTDVIGRAGARTDHTRVHDAESRRGIH